MLGKEMQTMEAMKGELAQTGVQTGLAIASGPAQSQVLTNCSLALACTRVMSLLHRSHPEHVLASKCSSYMRDTSFLSAGHDNLYKSLFLGSTGRGLPGTLACAIACVQGLPASHKVNVLQTGKKKKKKKHSGKINTEKPEAVTHTAAAALDVITTMPAFQPTAELKVCTLLPHADTLCISVLKSPLSCCLSSTCLAVAIGLQAKGTQFPQRTVYVLRAQQAALKFVCLRLCHCNLSYSICQAGHQQCCTTTETVICCHMCGYNITVAALQKIQELEEDLAQLVEQNAAAVQRADGLYSKNEALQHQVNTVSSDLSGRIQAWA